MILVTFPDQDFPYSNIGFFTDALEAVRNIDALKNTTRERPAPLLSAIHERNSSREASVESILDINKDPFCEAIQKSPALALMPKEVNANAHKGVWRTLFTYGTRVP